MSTAEKIPWEHLALNAEEVGQLLGCCARQVLERIACRPDFPTRISLRPATWVAGEVLAWRESNRAGRQGRRRRSGSRSSGS